jgi:MFS family permease
MLIKLSLLRRNRNLRWLYAGQFISFLGTMLTGVALPYQIYHETRSTLMVGLLSLFQLLPLIVTSLLGGVFADRYHRRQLLIIAESLLAIGCLLLAWNAHATSSITLLFVIATFMSALVGLHRPALDSISQQIVEPKDMAELSPLLGLKFSVCMIAGPAIAGLIIAHAGLVTVFIVDFITFAASLFALLMVRGVTKPVASKDVSTWQHLLSGFRYAASRQELLGTYLVDFFAMIFGMPTALFPAVALSFGGAKTLGLLYSAPAVGALVVSLVSGWTLRVKRHGLAIAIAASLWGVSIILFGLAKELWLALFFLALSGGLDAISGLFRVTIWNQTIPNKLRGRLAGIEMLSYLSGPKLGDTEAGLVAAAFGVTASIVSGGVLCVVSVLACCYFMPKFLSYKAPHNDD